VKKGSDPMARHIIDAPRPREDSGRFEKFVKIMRTNSDRPGTQTQKLRREAPTRVPGEKLRRFTDIERRET
jgi:hypothetical protein